MPSWTIHGGSSEIRLRHAGEIMYSCVKFIQNYPPKQRPCVQDSYHLDSGKTR